MYQRTRAEIVEREGSPWKRFKMKTARENAFRAEQDSSRQELRIPQGRDESFAKGP